MEGKKVKKVNQLVQMGEKIKMLKKMGYVTLCLIIVMLFGCVSTKSIKQKWEIYKQRITALEKEVYAIESAYITEKNKNFIVSLPEIILFDKGSAEILAASKSVLTEIAIEIKKYPDQLVLIKGYTCKLPIHNKKYVSNWELSADRSIAVLHYLLKDEDLRKEQFRILGIGENCPFDLGDEPKNLKLNRRVRIIILSPYMSERLGLNKPGHTPSGVITKKAENDL